MGLDMYLSQKVYLGHYAWDKERDEYSKAEEIVKLVGVVPQPDDDWSVWVSVRVAYWRKANHIHKWFVDSL